jgi:hypothetical protein
MSKRNQDFRPFVVPPLAAWMITLSIPSCPIPDLAKPPVLR